MQSKHIADRNSGNSLDNFYVITKFVSPLEKQLLNQKILLSNTPANSDDQIGLTHEVLKLEVLEHLVQGERVSIPHHALTWLFDPNTVFPDEEAKIQGSPPSQSQELRSHLFQASGLGEILGDLTEARLEKIAASDTFTANMWWLKQMLSAFPLVILRGARSLLQAGILTNVWRAVFSALITGLMSVIIELLGI